MAIAMRPTMKSDRIDGISEYCDRWCERCSFTLRCSAYAVHVATAMCDGDVEEALALALGEPRSTDAHEKPEPAWREELLHMQFTDTESDDSSRLEDARRERIEQAPLSTVTSAVTDLTVAWLERHRDALHKYGSSPIVDALQVVSWDVWFIAAKVRRALDGRDRFRHGEDGDDDPVQNDWNGSAKVALISIARSAAAYAVIAAATGDRDAARLGEELHALARQVEREFPDARNFVRPGFDAPPSSKTRRRR